MPEPVEETVTQTSEEVHRLMMIALHGDPETLAEELTALVDSHQVEWGVKYPSGAVQSYGQDKVSALRFSFAATALRPDLPALVVRKVVTPWEVTERG